MLESCGTCEDQQDDEDEPYENDKPDGLLPVCQNSMRVSVWALSALIAVTMTADVCVSHRG